MVGIKPETSCMVSKFVTSGLTVFFDFAGQWEKIESTLRRYVIQHRVKASILTLTLGITQLEDEQHEDRNIYLYYKETTGEKLIKVPKLYVKLNQDQSTRYSCSTCIDHYSQLKSADRYKGTNMRTKASYSLSGRPDSDLNFILTGFHLLFQLFYPGVVSYLLQHSCTPKPREENDIWMMFCEASYLYYISKIIDLLDTIFFVLRKKNSHITFLHVYHHAMMVLTTWAFLRYFKGEQGIFIGLLNSLVHVVMYSYYFLAALGPEVQKYLWWKKYITKFQLTQFALFCIHQLSLIVLSCDMPVALTYYIFFQAVVMCVLFGNFYYQTYTKKHNKQAKATE
ncbi:elongation of very long chain fatty acids protein AAEL008004-like [Diaphorina citri]|uniref:Elongation of very long chain fatty acids protein n=1 Tax=Diaphorina citri TaxID=121845 RepID=A0A1S4EE93_DIACI|nr:elongation of very long chain fatty acids protein AAEL008004-like [Diaphorina citri]